MLGLDAFDVVSMVGGWLFDRAMSGWDVTAFVADLTDTRSLQILGCRVQRLETSCLAMELLARPPVLAVAADLYSNDACVRGMVLAAVERGSDVVLWGDKCMHELDTVSPALYVLSRAAAVFKGHALMATGAPGPWPGQLEEFRAAVQSRALRGLQSAGAPMLQQVSNQGGMQ
ncbi:hypothetical protein [Mycolicibacterium hodleri]|uniref:hypothetical protein n=1 Tax=Mycolicibacterium hodleri TaxID=49897 RepID=UPI0011276083|nr:hypothetical protein [Mycolicibacterium hodleri]